MKKSANLKKKDRGALFIPAGIFLGLGFGFLYGRVVEGMFIGLGVGFVFFAIADMFGNKK